MAVDTALFFLVPAVLFALVFVVGSIKNRQRRRGLFCAARLLGTPPLDGSSEVEGVYGKTRVSFRYSYTRHPASSDPISWTETEVDLGDVDLSLTIRRRDASDTRHEPEFSTGHAEFDSEYIVEGAPNAIVRAALDRGIGERLMSLGRARVETPSRGLLRVRSPGHISDDIEIERRIELTAKLGHALLQAHAAATTAMAVTYREAPEAGATARANRQREVREFRRDQMRAKERQARQEQSSRRFVVILSCLALAFAGIVMWTVIKAI